jgi:hypothetical protein
VAGGDGWNSDRRGLEFRSVIVHHVAEMIQNSRFSGITRWQAILVALATLLLIASGFDGRKQAGAAKGVVPIEASSQDPDILLYNRIIDRVAAGGNYYQVVTDEQRRGGYPLKPFIVVRLPTLALISAFIGLSGAQILIWLLASATVFAWWHRIKDFSKVPEPAVLGALLIATGLTVSIRTELLVMHEIWAGTLLTLAFALHRNDRWWPTALLSLLAVLIREMALPFILLMAANAVWHRRVRESAVWAAIISIFAVALWMHALHISAYVHPNDPSSQGWNSFGGWIFFVNALSATSPLRVFPNEISAVLVPLALLGWAAWRTSVGSFGFLYLTGYGVMMMIFGRPENFYWSLLVAPLLLLGLLTLPAGITDLWAAITRKAEVI